MRESRKVLAIALMSFLAGCSTAARMEGMVPIVPTRSPAVADKTLRLEYTPGEQDRESEIKPETFMQALSEALRGSNLFSEIDPSTDPDYVLSTSIVTYHLESGVMNVPVTLIVSYSLSDARTGDEVWKKRILSNYEGTLGDSVLGVARIRLANEGAGRENIRLLLEELSQLEL
jgi:hypothetical protein